MNLRPEGEKVVVKPDTADKITKGGLVIPDSVHEKHQIAATRGTIVAIGPSASLRFSEGDDGVTAHEGKPGDRCIFAKYGGSSIWVDRQEYRILFDKDVVCLIEGDELEEDIEPRKSMVE